MLDRRTLKDVQAYGKHLFYHFSGGHILHVHLGLYGKFHRRPVPPPEPRGQVRLRLVSQDRAVDLNGPTACELLSRMQHDAIVARLGPDPLRDDADVTRVIERIRRSRSAVGKLLLDQSVMAGVGNVYRCEILYLLGIHPDRPGHEMTECECEQVWDTAVQLLRVGKKYNRIIVADPLDVGKPRGRMTRSERLLVYKKPFCGRCDAPIRTWELGARKIYACDRCQT